MTIPVLLAIIAIHAVLGLVSAAMPNEDGLECAEGAAGFSECVQGGTVAETLDSATVRISGAVEGEADGGGEADGERRSGNILDRAVSWIGDAGESISGFVVGLFGFVQGLWRVVSTFFSFDYAILQVEDDGSPGYGVWNMIQLVIRWGLTAVQVVLGVRLILALRGAG